MATTYDAIIVGAGHNGLTCAAYLAKAGTQGARSRAPRQSIGGATVSEEISSGLSPSRSCSYVVSLLRPQIIRDLELSRSTVSRSFRWTGRSHPFEDGTALVRGPRYRDEPAQHRALSRRKDAERYPLSSARP